MHPLLSVLFAACFTLLAVGHARAEQKAADFTLANGMRVVVIPDHRLPVVTHMVWYRAGAADDPPGVSGIAHFLEHLMFKSTQRMKSGEFARTISRLGGRDNASTVHDTTTYFERVAKEHLRTLMQLEADRMVNLRLTEEEVRTEREVIKEERRSNVDADPVSVLSEQMLTVLYRSHPYRRPVLGFADEMSRLTRQDAIAFYRRFYAPNNAILVVAGDVTPEEVKTLAEATYGRNKANPAVVRAAREPEPAPTASRRVHLEDARAGTSMLLRYYNVPSYPSAPGEAESLQVLAQIVGADDASRLYRQLVETKIADAANCKYVGNGLDSGRLIFLVIPAAGVALDKAEAALDAVIAELRKTGVTQQELDGAKSALEAQDVFESDDQSLLARRYGEGVALGRSVADVDAVPSRIQGTRLEDIRQAANTFLRLERSVTGTLTPPPQTVETVGSSLTPAKP